MPAQIQTSESLSEPVARLLQWSRGRPQGPMHIEFYPTNRCNIQCRICWQRGDAYDKTYATEMSDERVLRLVEEAADLGVTWWTIKGGGEPMARGKLVMEMLRRIRARGMNGLIQSNGTLFKPAQIEEIVALGWHRVVISLDGPTQEINDEIRSGGFEKATTTLRLLQEAKARAGTHLPEVYFNTVVTNRILDKLDQVIDLAHAHGVVNVYFSGLIRFTENCDPFLVDTRNLERFHAHVHETIAKAEALGITNNLHELINPNVWSSPNDRTFGEEYPTAKPLVDSLCYKPYTDLVVHPDGKTGPCCMSYDDRSDNLQEHSLAEVWEKGYMARVRGHFAHNRPMSYCAQCPTSLYRDNVVQREEFLAHDRSFPERLQRAVTRGTQGLREEGLAWTLRNTVQWFKVNVLG